MRLASRTVDNRERERDYTAHTEPRRATTKHARPTNAHFAGTGSSGIFSIPQRNSECSLSHVHRHSRRLPPRRWPLCPCVHLSHSSCLTSPGWGPYSLLASGQAHFTAGHDTVFQSPSMDNRSQLALQSHALCQCLPFHSHGGYQTNMGIKAHSSCGTRDVRPRFCVRPCDVIEICISLYRSSDASVYVRVT